MEENKEPVVVTVPQSESGVPDAVEMMTRAVVAEFAAVDGKVIGIDRQSPEECKMLTSYGRGTVSISVRRKEKPFMVSVCISDMMALLQAAAQRHHSLNKKMEEKHD